jgi:hypothetical protein
MRGLQEEEVSDKEMKDGEEYIIIVDEVLQPD